MKYDLSKMSILDFHKILNDPVGYGLIVADKIIEGGVMHLPVSELENVKKTLVQAMKELDEIGSMAKLTGEIEDFINNNDD